MKKGCPVGGRAAAGPAAGEGGRQGCAVRRRVWGGGGEGAVGQAAGEWGPAGCVVRRRILGRGRGGSGGVGGRGSTAKRWAESSCGGGVANAGQFGTKGFRTGGK
ncbi:hypothetical protein PR202_ga05806 [Eleusine coracana subsp. coracana]|uniref:Uncharacterized protein n=1 Tax=Eleusine coracana subsp. coracana TaxID=191504 RepID=A0AAV5BVN4_ELECO|nr:hypothetical protein PR202_ga05806 [Eleusine coracana subsp. coracana]